MRHSSYLLLIPVLLLTFWLGARGLNADPVWADEYFSIRDATGTGSSIIRPEQVWYDLGQRNPWHTPGFFILLNGWARLVGTTAPALRAFALLVGLLAVAWTYRLATLMVSRRAGLYAAAVLGTSAFFIYYLHELRMYTLFVLFTPMTLWAYLRLVDMPRKPTPALWLTFGLGALGLLYTHYFASLPLAAIGLYHLLVVPKTRRWWGIVGVMLAAVVLFLPWVSILIEGVNRAVAADNLHALALDAGQTLVRLALLFSNGAVPLLVVVLVAAAARRRTRRVWFFAGVLLAALLLTNQALQILAGGRLRYLMSLWALLAVLAGAGMVVLERWRRWAGRLVLAVWMALGVWNTGNVEFADVDGADVRFPSHDVAAAVRGQTLPSDLVLNVTADTGGYFRGAGEIDFGVLAVDYVFVGGRRDFEIEEAVIDGARTDDATLQSVFEPERLWVASLPERMPDGLGDLNAALDEDYAVCRAPVDRPELRVELYARSPVCCLDEPPPRLFQYGDAIFLSGIDMPAQAEDDVLRLSLLWTLDGDVTPNAYSVSLQVFDAAGEKVMQNDYGLAAQAYTCEQTTLDTAELPPGTYEVRATVYAWATGERLPGRVLSTGAQGDLLTVGTFTVAPN